MSVNIDHLFEDDSQWSFVALGSRFFNSPMTVYGESGCEYKIHRHPRGGWIAIEDLDYVLSQTHERYCTKKREFVWEKPFYTLDPTKEGLQNKPKE